MSPVTMKQYFYVWAHKLTTGGVSCYQNAKIEVAFFFISGLVQIVKTC